MLLAISNDLMAVAPIENACRQLGVACQTASLAQCVEREVAQPIRLVVLDLNAVDQVDEAITNLRTVIDPAVPVIAFGPHVHTTKLDAARKAGCAAVLTRGQFHQQARDVIAGFIKLTP